LHLRTEGLYQTRNLERVTARGGLASSDSQRASPHARTFPLLSLPPPRQIWVVKFRQTIPPPLPVDPSSSSSSFFRLAEERKEVRRFPLVVRGTNKISRFPRNQDGGVEEVAPPPRRSPLSGITRKSSGRVSSVHRSLRGCRCRVSLPNLVRGKERGAFVDRRWSPPILFGSIYCCRLQVSSLLDAIVVIALWQAVGMVPEFSSILLVGS